MDEPNAIDDQGRMRIPIDITPVLQRFELRPGEIELPTADGEGQEMVPAGLLIIYNPLHTGILTLDEQSARRLYDDLGALFHFGEPESALEVVREMPSAKGMRPKTPAEFGRDLGSQI